MYPYTERERGVYAPARRAPGGSARHASRSGPPRIKVYYMYIYIYIYTYIHIHIHIYTHIFMSTLNKYTY